MPSQSILLFIAVVLFYFLLGFLRSFLLWKKTGINALKFKAKDDAHGFIGRIFKFVSIAYLLHAFGNAFVEKADDFFLPIEFLQMVPIQYAGYTLMFLAFPLIWLAQLQMKNSWRIGIDANEKTELISSGLFGFSRNPIFLGILISALGYFLAVPDIFTFFLLGFSWLSIQIQVRLEEEYLLTQHGEAYRNYASKVRRWL